jgi:hypothetical protein
MLISIYCNKEKIIVFCQRLRVSIMPRHLCILTVLGMQLICLGVSIRLAFWASRFIRRSNFQISTTYMAFDVGWFGL